MDTISYVDLVSLSTIKAHVSIIIPIHYYCILIQCYQFYHLLHIWSQLVNSTHKHVNYATPVFVLHVVAR